MLRKIRITLATLMLVMLTLLFLDFSGSLRWASCLAKLQLVPALLALNVGAVVAVLVVTLVMGRFYCSVVCPMGILQDIISRLRSPRRRNRFSYSPAKSWLRYGVLALYVVAGVAGLHVVVALLDPYSAYGRMVNNLLTPIYRKGNNLLAIAAEHVGSYAFYRVEIADIVVPTIAVAGVTLVVIAVLAWLHGRTYCNTICPVGTLLGLLSRYSFVKVKLDEDKCISCGRCERACKASALDVKTHTIDYSRCVVCGDCIDRCHRSGITFSLPRKAAKTADEPTAEHYPSRRAFLVGTALTTATLALGEEQMKVDGGLAAIEDKQKPKRKTPITPPGSLSASNMAKRCTACQLCVSACPNGVLQPSTSLLTLMQPTVSYERGYCRPECVRCSAVCPTGAIRKISPADKAATHIGHAVWVKKNCVPLSDGVECGNCARHCPTGAITMIQSDPNDDGSPRIPAVDESRCIGCGACENLCPARPFSAIYVEGHEQHSTD